MYNTTLEFDYIIMVEQGFDQTAVRTLWSFLCLTTYNPAEVGRCDFVLAHGNSSFKETVFKAVQVIEESDGAPFLVCSGRGPNQAVPYHDSEAIRMRRIAIRLGMDRYRVLIEPWSTNTGDNLTRTRDLLDRSGLAYRSATLVGLPFAGRRADATARRLWPELSCVTATFTTDWELYLMSRMGNDPSRLIRALRGEVSRLKQYPARGYTVSVAVPTDVDDAYCSLAGFGER